MKTFYVSTALGVKGLIRTVARDVRKFIRDPKGWRSGRMPARVGPDDDSDVHVPIAIYDDPTAIAHTAIVYAKTSEKRLSTVFDPISKAFPLRHVDAWVPIIIVTDDKEMLESYMRQYGYFNREWIVMADDVRTALAKALMKIMQIRGGQS